MMGLGSAVRAVGVAAAVAFAVLAGCTSPFRAHVDPAVLRSELPWVESVEEEESSGGWLGASTVETDYVHDARGPPYPGLLQVFSARGATHDRETLLSVARDVVDAAMRAQSIQASSEGRHDGTRTLATGLETRWFTLEGTVTATGPLFTQSVRVRILGEVGYDGLSGTSVVAVGLAQVAATGSCPVLVQCQPRTDLRTWESLAGDPEGSPAWGKSGNGLMDHLVTHD